MSCRREVLKVATDYCILLPLVVLNLPLMSLESRALK